MTINAWKPVNSWDAVVVTPTTYTNQLIVVDVDNAILVGCLVVGSVSNSTTTDSVAYGFTNCTESFTSILNQSWLTTGNEINEVGQLALAGKASGGGNLIEWAYAVATPITVAINHRKIIRVKRKSNTIRVR